MLTRIKMRITEIMLQKLNIFFAILDMVLADLKPIVWFIAALSMIVNLSPYLWGPMMVVWLGAYGYFLAHEFRHRLEKAADKLRWKELRQREEQLHNRQSSMIDDLLEENNRKSEIILRLATRLSESENPENSGGDGQQAPAA